MGSKRLAVTIAIVTVLGGIPAVSAEHLSAGYEDAVGVEAQERAGASVSDEEHQRGIDTDCFEANGTQASQEKFQNASEADPFCGELVYHEDTNITQEAPEDQDHRATSESALNRSVDVFDTQTTRSYMLAHEARLIRSDVSPCTPFCSDTPTGQLAWEAVHKAGSEAQLTESPKDANSSERDDRFQLYGADVHTTTSGVLLQQTADTHEMNGWYVPGPTRSFVAFLEDNQDNPISDDRLETMVTELQKQGDLPQGAIPAVCGWTPDGDFSSTGGAYPCEIPFEYERQSSTGDGDADFKDGYNDKCKSPTYVCSQQSGGAWYANFDCLCSTFAATDYITFHWVVAPTLVQDCGAREPGFLTTPEETSTKYPYLAHDLDVFVNPTATNANEQPNSTPAIRDQALAVAGEQIGQASEDVDNVTENVTEPVPGLQDGVSLPAQAAKSDRVEPNADPVDGLEDTSQSLPSEHADGNELFRSLDDCEELTADETEDTIDPWVDLIDGETIKQATSTDQVVYTANNGHVGSATQTGFSVGAYGNEDPDQDDDNHPGPDLYRTEGNVGLFTDKNDDGAYETVDGDTQTFSGTKTNSDEIESVGAYPMLWDIRLDDNGNIDTEAGCQISQTTLTKGAVDAGYGPETGLFQAVYLSESTVFVDATNQNVVDYPTGNNIYLFLSQSARDLYKPDTLDANHVDAQIDEAIDELRSSVADGAAVQVPGDGFDYASDFQTQCDEDTGGFTLEFSFAHSCQLDCSGDTIVTGYAFELEDDQLGGGALLPTFPADGFEYGSGTYSWFDVDPFDNDPDRQDGNDDSPPTEDDAEE
jgi:hypothetical protein